MSDAPPAVRLADVHRHVRDASGATIRAVDGVTLDVAPGTLVVVTGPSGSGKTTLLALVAGLVAPTGGGVTVAGTPLAGLAQRALTAFRLRRVGVVFQASHLVAALPVVENVELPLALAGVRRPASRTRAVAALAALGLGARLASRPAALSGGERQRVAIARALVHDPPLLVCDEPTGSLDRDAADAVHALLRAQADAGRTVLVATHDPALAAIADRVVRLAFGRVVAP